MLVRRFERLGNLPRYWQRLGDRNCSTCEALRQVLTLDQLHDERRDAVRLFEAVDAADVRMIQRRERFCFPLKPGKAIRVAGKGVRENFQRDITPELCIAPSIHFAHSADPKGGEDLVRAEAGAGAEDHRCRRELYGRGGGAGRTELLLWNALVHGDPAWRLRGA
jgi:hypothetical protein